MVSKIEPHKTKKTAEQKIPALKQGVLQNNHFDTFEFGKKICNEIYGTGLSDKVIRTIYANFRLALEKVVQEGLIQINPEFQSFLLCEIYLKTPNTTIPRTAEITIKTMGEISFLASFL